MRILCLPIDSRPCNTQMIQRMLRWAGCECVLPRPEEMDDFRIPAPYAGSQAFLRRDLPGCDAAVISLDHWCFGSLLASREEDVSLAQALERVEELHTLLREYPHVPVYMSTVILRSSISTFSQQDIQAYEAMTAYSVASDRYACFGREEDRAALEQAQALIPPDILEKVLRVRQRNVQVNLAAVRLAAAGAITSLSVLQEDSQVYGLPKKDQRMIRQEMDRLQTRNVFLRNGTDEAGAVSAAAALRKGQPPLDVEIAFLGQKDFTAPYEDRPFSENLLSACREIGLVSHAGSGRMIAVLCPEHGEQAEATFPADPNYLARCAARIDEWMKQGKQVYLLDVVRANGGCPGLFAALKQAPSLAGYSAWNTASNAMGTLLCQVVTDARRGEPNRAFYQERLLDDLMYQSELRASLQKNVLAQGDDPYCLHRKEEAENLLRALYRQAMASLWPLPAVPEYRVSLPWKRTFEVKAEVMD